MGKIIQFNVRGLKSDDSREKKSIFKLLDEQDTKYVSLQETRLKEYNQIPIQLQHYKHLYHISYLRSYKRRFGKWYTDFCK